MLSMAKTAYSLVTPTEYGINSSDVSITVALEQVLKYCTCVLALNWLQVSIVMF